MSSAIRIQTFDYNSGLSSMLAFMATKSWLMYVLHPTSYTKNALKLHALPSDLVAVLSKFAQTGYGGIRVNQL
jgi:hypothetical protein